MNDWLKQGRSPCSHLEHAAIPGTSLDVSRVAIGTWAIGGWMWGGTDEAESIATIPAAVERGINIIDTAPAYGFGRSEEIVGRALAEGNLRSRVLIATKVGLEWEGRRVFRNASRARILEEVEASLRRLRTDYIDIYQVHWPDPLVTIEETAEACTRCSSRARSAPSASATFQSNKWSGSAVLRRCMCCSRPITCSSAASKPASCPIASSTRSRCSAMARCAAVSFPAGCGRTANSRATICAARIQNSSSPASRNILLRWSGSIGSRSNVLASASSIWRSAGCWTRASRRPCGGARRPGQLQPVDEVSGWWLDASAKAEIDRILSATISEPIGPEFMAPPARSFAAA